MNVSEQYLNILTTGLVIFLSLLFALWVSLVIWAYRDMRSRSRDLFAQILTVVVVALLPVVGILIYLILRPSETLSESFERALAEEALLQEIEKKPHCPGCSRNIRTGWQICPYCHVRLKQPCFKCDELIELQWTICPYCTTQQHLESPHLNADEEMISSEPTSEKFHYQDDEPGIWTVSD